MNFFDALLHQLSGESWANCKTFFVSQDPASSSIGYDEETEGLIQSDGARPSTSRGFRDEEDSSAADEKSKLIKEKTQEEKDKEEKEKEAAKKRKILMGKLMMIPTFLSSVLVSITLRLHRVSRSYRYVMRVLAREKKTLKVCLRTISTVMLTDFVFLQHSPGFGAGFRSGSNMIWTPIQNAKTSR